MDRESRGRRRLFQAHPANRVRAGRTYRPAGLALVSTSLPQRHRGRARRLLSNLDAQAHFERGLDDRLHAMEAELLVIHEQEQAIVLHNRQLITEIALTMALGGGYSD